jgi:hypothetical protein
LGVLLLRMCVYALENVLELCCDSDIFAGAAKSVQTDRACDSNT